jgi:hypothetical protein
VAHCRPGCGLPGAEKSCLRGKKAQLKLEREILKNRGHHLGDARLIFISIKQYRNIWPSAVAMSGFWTIGQQFLSRA